MRLKEWRRGQCGCSRRERDGRGGLKSQKHQGQISVSFVAIKGFWLLLCMPGSSLHTQAGWNVTGLIRKRKKYGRHGAVGPVLG